MLLNNASQALPEAGYFEQADRLFAELEHRADPTGLPGILHAKANYLAEYRDADAAAVVYARVIALDLQQLKEDPENLPVLIRLLEVHAGTGERAKAEEYLQLVEARIHDNVRRLELRLTESGVEGRWIDGIWDDASSINDRIARQLIHLGDARATLGALDDAIDQYLSASPYATWGDTRRFLATRYLEAAGKCTDEPLPDPHSEWMAADEYIQAKKNFCAQYLTHL